MVYTGTARMIVGIVGNAVSCGLFLSPILTFITICKKKTAAGFKPDPYVATVLNRTLWVFYGMPIVHPDSLLVVTINGFGLGLELIYIGIFLIYSPWNRRRNILLALLVELIFMAAVVRSAFVRTLCIIFNIAMYTSPLTIMTKSVKYMPFYLSLANFLNGIIRCAPQIRSLCPADLGALSGLVQLILYATYYRTTQWDEPKKPASEVELSSA
ncbi:hypothetical protein ACJRO7_009519 [Eucalyptus globulus]|uniref:Bidirectional sugar transporter SWEET n=1 Tax=Eucalyptus globulus TaxID=34317 RepID=A0ABD3L8Y4_EUCGL